MRFAENKIFLVLASVLVGATSSSIASQFASRMGPARILASWTEDVSRLKGERGQYLLY
jgi:hypothetical protein